LYESTDHTTQVTTETLVVTNHTTQITVETPLWHLLIISAHW